MCFIGKFGLKNVVDFNDECGYFFTKDNCKMLKLMFDMYMHYAANHSSDNQKDIYCDKDGKFTKDQFYESMKRMIKYGPSNGDEAPDYRSITGEFRVRNPELFISEEAPEELQKLFYTKSLTFQKIKENPEYISYLKDIDLEVWHKYMPIKLKDKRVGYDWGEGSFVNLIKVIKDKFGSEDSFSIMMVYGAYIEQIYENYRLSGFQLQSNCSKEDLLNELDACIFKSIIEGKIKYNDDISIHFQNSNPTLFLEKDVPEELRKKFYNRQFSLEDFSSNLDLLDILGKTNIVCGFSEEVAWMIPLFGDSDNPKKANYNRLKIISAYSKIQDVELQNAFKEYVMEFGNSIDIEKIKYVSEVLSRLSLSNSSEIFTFRKELATQILNSSNPIENLNKIEDIFIRNNIPTVGKIYSCFEILHPDFQGFNFDSSMVSPVLKKSSTMAKKIVVFSDLIKSSFGSNNRSVNAYLKNIEVGSKLYESINQDKFNIIYLMKTKKLN